MMARIRSMAAIIGGLALAFTFAGPMTWGQERPLNPGDPLPGISATDFSEFRLGLEDFTEVETAEDGLGPAYNGTSCAVCHNVPAIGGSGVILETRAGYRGEDNRHFGLNEAGDTLVHLFSIPNHTCQPIMPDGANVIARRARFLYLVQAWSRRSQTRRCLRSRIRWTAIGTA